MASADATSGTKRMLDCASKPVPKKLKRALEQKKVEKERSARVLRELLGEPEPCPVEAPAAAKKKTIGNASADKSSDSDKVVTNAVPAQTVAATKKAVVKSRPSISKGVKHEPEHVEGVFSKDGDMYLRDTATNKVFASTRDQYGGLVLVGMWDAKAASIDFNLPKDAPPKKVLKAAPQPAAEEVESKVPRFRPRVEEDYPFTAEEDDHCETGAQAYADIKPFLAQLCLRLGKTPDTLQVYDPYYCAGSVVRHLSALGYTNVYNKNEDFYAKIADGSVPEYDVLITNPPYSEDHVERLLKFCVREQKPWLLLIPNYVYTKPFYPTVLESGPAPSKPLYVVPKKRYCYWTPKGIARNNPKVRKDGRTSPFITFWYVDCQKNNSQILRWWQQKGYNKHPQLKVVKDVKNLPESVMEKVRPMVKKHGSHKAGKAAGTS